ncbi:MAG: hypothetical protein AVDCRST_MAG26-1906 [uncultured Chloroflexia bacterium]|uniref:DUF4178 domain-containing protein n=1 Tax=uncultured Chloroflexia bacterium TaxID=1672391 RepID=A0A6J4IIC1_9CHLR|nr:MAG: hypothetical protein AVDCRST_MAG26-1906 [uncultured Chloroflexia bacterium]
MELRLDQFKRGDILTLVGEIEHLLIEKVWLSQQGSYRWVDYETRTHGSQRRVIISAEYDDGEWETVVYDQFPDAREVPDADSLPGRLTWNGATYHLDERGTCMMELVDLRDEPLRCEYADYTGPGDAVLAVERFSGDNVDVPAEVEIFAGASVRPSFVQLFAPGDQAERPGLLIKTRAMPHPKKTARRLTAGQQVIIGGVAFAVLLLLIVMVLAR